MGSTILLLLLLINLIGVTAVIFFSAVNPLKSTLNYPVPLALLTIRPLDLSSVKSLLVGSYL